MEKFLTLWIGLIFILTGCIGENYDFSPPVLTLSSDSNLQSEELVEANIHWRGEGGEPIEKQTNDILTLAKQQQQMFFNVGEEVDLLSNHGDFLTEELSVALWEGDKKVELEMNDTSFFLPEEKGEYVIEVNLQTDRGNAQYVGNLVVK